ncbi:hypothetical protein [Halobacillus salinus]|uniref:hypothetical protein n=1 Tax=Halobacillus salinus TaxID=192814 RepID=UPI0009A759BF|nr:hypothetical protein [Halobacillus salinus]
MIFRFISIVFLCFLLVACGTEPQTTPDSNATENPSPADFSKEEQADFFVIDGVVYSNVEGAQWAEGLEYTLGEQLGEIKKQRTDEEEFESFTASQLPVGTKIYETDTRLYIAIVDNKEIPYVKMIEG